MKKLALVAALVLPVFAPGPLSGQVNLGAQISWADNADFGFGGRIAARSPLVDPAIEFIGTFDFFFPGVPAGADDSAYWEANLNFVYNIPVQHESLRPYAGGGLNIAYGSVTIGSVKASSTDVGANLLGGIKYVKGAIIPFGEIRYELGGGEQFVLTGGFLFVIS
ncbi:MAG TPA: hypothetical protein VLC48_05470 [Gemmatimonadota bacterium]|nr:hypothetical protein [Gemmatimonadota bacterium]